MKKLVFFLFVVSFAFMANAQVIKVVKPTSLNEQVFDAVETMPEYPGGDEAIMTFIGNNVQYPVDAQEKGIQGTAVIRFVVNKVGQVEKAEIIRSVFPSIDAEAIRVVNMLKGWKAGVQKGKKVDVYFTLPIRFKLDTNTAEKKSPSLVKEKQIILLDGNRLAVGFDLSKIKASDYNIEVRKPETEAIKASLIEKYGPDAEFGVVILTSKTKVNPLVKDSLQATSQKKIILEEPEVMPTYPGGETALMSFISFNIRYPEDAREANIKGTCVVKFVVNQSGNVESPKIVRSVCPSIDKESIRVVSLLRGWNPGIQKGKPINVYYTLPIRFRLDNSNEDYPMRTR